MKAETDREANCVAKWEKHRWSWRKTWQDQDQSQDHKSRPSSWVWQLCGVSGSI